MSEIITVGLDLAKNMFSRCMDALLTLKFLTAALAQLEAEIGKLDVEIARRAKENELARRLMTVH